MHEGREGEWVQLAPSLWASPFHVACAGPFLDTRGPLYRSSRTFRWLQAAKGCCSTTLRIFSV